MIVTLTEAKTYLKVTGTEDDQAIQDLIFSVQEQIFTYCNNWFIDPRFDFSSGSLVFVPGTGTPVTGAKITDVNNDFNSLDFYAGMEILIKCANRNYGNKTVNTVTSGPNELLLVDGEVLISESSTDQIYLFKMVIPDSLKHLALKMIQLNYTGGGISSNINSEKVGNYSVTYGNPQGADGQYFYPAGIQGQLNMFRKPGFVAVGDQVPNLCFGYTRLRFQL